MFMGKNNHRILVRNMHCDYEQVDDAISLWSHDDFLRE